MLCKEASKNCWDSYSVVVSGDEEDRQKNLGKEKQRKERNRIWEAAGSPEGCPGVPGSRTPEQQPVLPGRHSGVEPGHLAVGVLCLLSV